MESTTDTARIARLFKPYRARLGSVLALIGLSAGLSMVSPFLLREVLDQAIPERDTALLTWLVAGMVAISIVTGALGVAQTWLSNLVGQRVMHDLRAGGDRDRDHAPHQPGQQLGVGVGDGFVEHLAQQEGRDHAQPRREPDEGEHRRQASPIGLEEARDARAVGAVAHDASGYRSS